MQTPWEYRYAHRMKRWEVRSSASSSSMPNSPTSSRSPAACRPPKSFRSRNSRKPATTVLREQGAQALQYSTTEGYLPLREMIARHTSRYMVAVTPDNILITSGSQQALDFIGRLFVNRGDYIVVESPTYLGALQAWNAYGAQYIPVPMDEDGMLVDQLEEALRKGPKFIYVLPNFQNPSGATLSLERRKQSSSWPTSTASRSSRTIRTVSCATRASTSPRWCIWTANIRGYDGELLQRQRHLPEHVLQAAGARPAPGLGHRARAGHPQAGHHQAGRRPAHRLLQPVRRLRGRQGRLPGRACQVHPAGVQGTPRRHARNDGRDVPAGGPLDQAAGRHVPVGHPARAHGRGRGAEDRPAAQGRLRAPAARSTPPAAARTRCASTSPTPTRTPSARASRASGTTLKELLHEKVPA